MVVGFLTALLLGTGVKLLFTQRSLREIKEDCLQ